MNTPLLKLESIGKIYVSDNNIAVGIRGVDLSFERGEFVAVTGKSGSGKSTLLNVISGMDTYEEGELYVEGEPTSHYLQKDWEEYRKQYISFIFQEYNIIESFTVLQNVELALMNIDDPRKRREKAMELIRRVGLEKHIHHKGSKLSGGQKQRTVIARALAKDSPILLCDEPTGNLDSKSSEEIISLLREVSKEKLVIIVTHNFEQVEAYATRHIRIYDGAVESDYTIQAPVAPPAEKTPSYQPRVTSRFSHTLRNGLHLGRVRFKATPKLSTFLCILMTLTSLAIALSTSLTYDSRELWGENTMFTHMEGRTVILRQDGGILTDEELSDLATKVGAEHFLHYDYMLDESVEIWFEDATRIDSFMFSFGYPAQSIKLDAGRYPEADNEVIMEVPIFLKTYLEDGSFKEREESLFDNMATYRVVGVRYYYDNTRQPRLLFTENGYKLASAISYYSKHRNNFTYYFDVVDPLNGKIGYNVSLSDCYVDFSMEPGTYFINDMSIANIISRIPEITSREELIVKGLVKGNFRSYYYGGYDIYDKYDGGFSMDSVSMGQDSINYALDAYKNVWSMTDTMKENLSRSKYYVWDEKVNAFPELLAVIVSPDVMTDLLYKEYFAHAYTQASLFFENDRVAHSKVDQLRELGYIAVVSDETIQVEAFDLIFEKIMAMFQAALWLMAILFISLFLSLCSSRAMNATRGDVGILRSMGIPTSVVKISIYVQTLLALIPAVVVTLITCTILFLFPQTNYLFPFLHVGDYILMALVVLLIALNLSHRYVKKMFDQSVKKTLRSSKGGSKS